MNTLTVIRGNVLARVRSGDQSARREVRATIDSGVRLLLARRLDGRPLDNAIADVHERVLLAITENTIATLDELTAFVQSIVNLQVPTRTAKAPASVNPQAVRNLQDAMSAGELELLHRYYVLGESTKRISEAMGVNIAAIEAVKQRARQAHQKPLGGVATVVMPHGRVA